MSSHPSGGRFVFSHEGGRRGRGRWAGGAHRRAPRGITSHKYIIMFGPIPTYDPLVGGDPLLPLAMVGNGGNSDRGGNGAENDRDDEPFENMNRNRAAM